MRPGQSPTTQSAVCNQGRRAEGLDLCGDLHIPELTQVVIVLFGAGPAKKNIARALHEALALHNPYTLMAIAAPSARRLQHGPARFLDLKEQWIHVIREKQREITARADTSDSNNLDCTVLKAVALEQLLSIRL